MTNLSKCLLVCFCFCVQFSLAQKPIPAATLSSIKNPGVRTIIEKANAQLLGYQFGTVTQFYLSTNVTRGTNSDGTVSPKASLIITMRLLPTLNTEATDAEISFSKSDSIPFVRYDSAFKKISLVYPIAYYDAVMDMLNNSFYAPETQRRKLTVYWADEGNGNSSGGFYQ